MEGAVIKELAERLRKPEQIGSLIAAPDDWQLHNPERILAAAKPRATVLDVQTLASLKDYLLANRDQLDLGTLLVHVEGPNRVSIGSALRPLSRDREVFLTAAAVDMTEGFLNQFLDIEPFIIGLQSRFVDADQRAAVLQVVSSIRTEQTRTATDDGTSQTLEARAGVAMRAAATLPNPVQLTPYRTFREIRQPSAPFILRANVNQGQLPKLALFEADGGTWKLNTLLDIRGWLKENLPLSVAVLA